MGGFFGVVSKRDAISDVFFGTDYHSHLGTHRAGIAAYDPELGLQREIKSIQNAPFRTKFEYNDAGHQCHRLYQRLLSAAAFDSFFSWYFRFVLDR